jgi:DNA polymerase-1
MALSDFQDMQTYPLEQLAIGTSPFAFDTETLGYSDALNTPFYYSWASDDLGIGAAPITTEKGWEFFQALCASKRPKVFANCKFDLTAIERLDLHVNEEGGIHDIILQHCLIDELPPHGLKILSARYLDYARTNDLEEYWVSQGLVGPKRRLLRLNTNVPPELMYKYACEDARDTWDLFNRFRNVLLGTGGWEHYLDCCQAELMYRRIETHGIRADRQVIDETIPILQTAADALLPKIYDGLNKGIEFNPGSYAQLAHVLKDVYGLPLWKTTDGGSYETGKEILQQFIADPNIQYLQAWKFLTKAKIDLRGYQKRLTKDDRLHPSYHQRTVTGRAGCADPNLMNIPKQQGRISEVDVGDKDLAELCASAFRKVRSCIIADEDAVFVTRDYNQGEYRAFTYYSGSQRLIQRLVQGEDFHEIVCKLVFGDHTPRLRHVIKIVNFGLIYGMGEPLLKATIAHGDPNIDPSDVLYRYEQFLPEMRDTQQRIIAKGKACGYVTDVFGRRYHYMREAPHKLVSWLCQGTIAGVKKKSMARLKQIFYTSHSVLNIDIHDELVFNMFREEAELQLQVRPIMEDFPQFGGIPITTDCKAGFDLLNVKTVNETELQHFIKTHEYLRKVG